jgi:hypothetical protein
MAEQRGDAPTWQPLGRLPLVASMIDSGLAGAREQHEILVRARRHPVLDDETVDRVVRVFTDTRAHVEHHEKQLARWREEVLSPSRRREIDRLSDQLYELRRLVEAILALVDGLKGRTIDRTLERSDVALGLEFLAAAPPLADVPRLHVLATTRHGHEPRVR